MRWQIFFPTSHRKNVLSLQSSISPKKNSVTSITQISTLFFLIVLGGENKQFVQADCSSQIQTCPLNPSGNGRYNCMAGEKKYEDIFPGVNTGEISGQECTDYDCAYCDCNEETVTREMGGYTGLKCETKFEICADGHVCFHGAPCVVTNTGEYICDCHSIESSNTFLGDHCEYKADSLCISSPEDSFDYPAFCTNNGKCREGIGNPFDKCECEKGFYGLHCEFKYEPSCEISCKNGGVCNRGVKIENEYDDMYNDDDFNQQASASYCVCPDGWEGEECQSEDNCNCRNGSTCQHSAYSFSYCDCSTTNILSHSTGAKVQFAGLKCESMITTKCPGQEGHSDSEYFCTNGGRCPKEPHLPCNCPLGTDFSGPRCEFKGTATKECSIPCENGGTCFFGSKPNNFLGDYGKSQMHCKCPKGYTGIMCELPVDICDAGEHHCLNNGKCVKDGEDYKCDCTTAITHMIHAGEHCEHEATSFCQGSGANTNSFCTNRGTCKDTIDTSTNSVHPGCDCESPFFGDHCEKGATLEQTLAVYCEGPGGFLCYNHGTCKELPGTSTVRAHPGCVCEPPYFGDLCQYKSTDLDDDSKAFKAFLGFTIALFVLLAIFFIIVFFKTKKESNRNIDHTPIGVPPEVHVHAMDLDNAKIMGEEEVMENVYIS